jgi:hypothetical protein
MNESYLPKLSGGRNALNKLKYIQYIYAHFDTLHLVLFYLSNCDHEFWYRIGGVKVGVLATGNHTTLRRKGKDLLAQNSDNESEWRDMPTNRLLSQWSSTIKIQFIVLVEYKADIIIISLNSTYTRHDTAEILPIFHLRTITYSNNYNTLCE